MSSRSWRAVAARIDRGLYTLFSPHANRPRHDRDRDRYRGSGLSAGFETYLARTYGLSWLVGVAVAGAAFMFVLALTPDGPATVGRFVSAAIPGDRPTIPVTGTTLLVAISLSIGAAGKRITIALGGTYLRWQANARRAAIERTLPGAVRYLRVLADGSEGREAMLRKVTDGGAYGETGEAFERVLKTAALTGSLDTGLRNVARQTPSRELFAPFLLKFREHANQGTDSLRGYLRMESRMLSHQQSRTRQRSGDYRKLLAEFFIALLVIPALVVVIVTVLSVLGSGLSKPIPLPGEPTVRTLLVYGNAAFIVVVGASTAAVVARLRPSKLGQTYERPTGYETLRTALTSPASAAFVFAFPAVVVGWGLWAVDEPLANVVLLGYAVYGLPVGTVAVNRARIDDTKDREIRDFIHAVAGHVSLGHPFESAVESAAGEVNFGALQSDVDVLAFRLGLTTGSADVDTRREALGRFVARVGTPLAEQTIGLVSGALAVGSDAETTFETLQMEIGSLYHQRKRLQSAMFVYVVVGWTTALFVIGIAVVADAHVVGWFARFSADTSGSGTAIVPAAGRDIWGFYIVTQATMLACGWFSGMCSRGRYAALLHSSILVVICYLVFVGAETI